MPSSASRVCRQADEYPPVGVNSSEKRRDAGTVFWSRKTRRDGGCDVGTERVTPLEFFGAKTACGGGDVDCEFGGRSVCVSQFNSLAQRRLSAQTLYNPPWLGSGARGKILEKDMC